MILKIKNGNSWTFIDKITEVEKIMNTELEPSRFISYTHQGEIQKRDISEGCYLLNDEGKTIEKLA